MCPLSRFGCSPSRSAGPECDLWASQRSARALTVFAPVVRFASALPLLPDACVGLGFSDRIAPGSNPASPPTYERPDASGRAFDVVGDNGRSSNFRDGS